MAIPSILTVSSLNDQCGHSSFNASDFVDGQPSNTYSDIIPKYSLSRVAKHISFAVIQSSTSMHDSIAFMLMLIPGISLSLFVSWLCLDSHSAMKSSGPGL